MLGPRHSRRQGWGVRAVGLSLALGRMGGGGRAAARGCLE